MNENNFIKALKRKVLVLDGAMGTSIESYNLPIDNNNYDYLTLTHPQIISNIHRSFLNGGADIIETNTLNSNAICQSQYGLTHKVYEMNYKGAKLAKSIAKEFSENHNNKPLFVAGSIGPTTKICVENPKGKYEVCFNELFSCYKEQITALVKGGVDLLLIETITNINNAKAALKAAEHIFCELNIKLPIFASVTLVNKSNKTIDGMSILDFMKEIQSENLIGVGLNCFLPYSEVIDEIIKLSNKDKRFIIIYPNAGMPDNCGNYSETPEEIALFMKKLIENSSVNIVGGCCGTTAAHIEAIAHIVNNIEFK